MRYLGNLELMFFYIVKKKPFLMSDHNNIEQRPAGHRDL